MFAIRQGICGMGFSVELSCNIPQTWFGRWLINTGERRERFLYVTPLGFLLLLLLCYERSTFYFTLCCCTLLNANLHNFPTHAGKKATRLILTGLCYHSVRAWGIVRTFHPSGRASTDRSSTDRLSTNRSSTDR